MFIFSDRFVYKSTHTAYRQHYNIGIGIID